MIQWVKAVGLEAANIDQDMEAQLEPGTILSYPFGQMKHSLAVTDTIIHTKSALDSMGVLLNNFLRLNLGKRKRDFKIAEFRRLVSDRDVVLGELMKELEPWFQELQGIRDEWIHRSSVRNVLIFGESPVGILPIPKKNLDAGLRAFDTPITPQNFWSTREFLQHNYLNLVRVFNAIIARCIESESIALRAPLVDPEVERNLIFFPFRLTTSMSVSRIRAKLGPTEPIGYLDIVSDGIKAIPHSQIGDLEKPMRELTELLSKNEADESKYQELIRRYPWILGAQYESVEDHQKLDDKNIPDFTGVRARDRNRDILEIKSPFTPVLRQDGELTSDFNEAWNQSERYLNFAREEKDYLRRKGLAFENPKCYLIAGYKLGDDALNKIRIKQRMNPAIDVLTYDDLIALTQKTVEFVRSLQSKS
jgi:hypothetical protein